MMFKIMLALIVPTIAGATDAAGVKWLAEKATENGVHATGSGLLYKVRRLNLFKFHKFRIRARSVTGHQKLAVSVQVPTCVDTN